MKKIIYLLLPMILVIAIIFNIREKVFDSHTFLDFIASLRFTNAYDQLLVTQDKWEIVADAWNNIKNAKNIFDVIANVDDAIIGIFKTTLSLGITVFDLITDTINNVGNIISWLLIS